MNRIAVVDRVEPDLERALRPALLRHGWSLDIIGSLDGGVRAVLGDPNSYVALLVEGGLIQQAGGEALRDVARASEEVPLVVLVADKNLASVGELALALKTGAVNAISRGQLSSGRLEGLFREIVDTRTTLRLGTPVGGLSKTAGPEPAFASVDRIDGSVSAFALRLRGYASDPGGQTTTALERRQAEWIRRLVSTLYVVAPRWFELRYAVTHSGEPDARPILSVLLAGFGKGATTPDAMAVARELWMDMESIVKVDDIVYPFTPVRNVEVLRALLRPFVPQHVVEVSASSGRLLAPDRSPRAIGFRSESTDQGESADIDLPVVLAPEPRGASTICAALLSSRWPIQLTVRFEAGELSAQERGLLEVVSEAEATDASEWRFSPAPASTVVAAADATQVGQLAAELCTRFARHFSVRGVVDSAGSISRPITALVAELLQGRNPSTWQFDEWRGSAAADIQRPWGLHFGDQAFNRRLRTLKPVPDAWGALRLPLAGDEPIPGLDRIPASHSNVPVNLPTSGLQLGEKRTPGGSLAIYQPDEDRLRHTYILGQTGAGKSTLLATMAAQDMEAGRGIGVLDPHGDLIEDLLAAVPRSRRDDVVFVDLSDPSRSVGLNLLEYDRTRPQQKTFFITELMAIFHQLYNLDLAGGPLFDNYMFNSLLLLMEDRDTTATLLDVTKIFVDQKFRHTLLSRSPSPHVTMFWEQAEATGGDHALRNLGPYITSKLNQFVSNDYLRPIVTQQKSTIDFRSIVDSGKILLVNLAKGHLGEMSARLIGMVMVSRILAATLGRASVDRSVRRPYYLYVDEFQSFTTVPQLLSEVRKYGLALVLANQNLQQLQDDTLHAVLGNVGTLLFFRPGPPDAERVLPYVRPSFSTSDLVSLPNFTVLGRLLADGAPLEPFLFQTAWKPKVVDPEWVAELKACSNALYTTPAAVQESDPTAESEEQVDAEARVVAPILTSAIPDDTPATQSTTGSRVNGDTRHPPSDEDERNLVCLYMIRRRLVDVLNECLIMRSSPGAELAAPTSLVDELQSQDADADKAVG